MKATTSYRIGVVAHTARAEQAHQLADRVGVQFLHMDDGTKGCDKSHRRVWQYLSGLESDWCVVLEDDAEPLDGFTGQLEQALPSAPTDVVSFYLGTGRPPHWQQRIRNIIDTEAHWITSTHLLHAVAVAIRTSLVPHMLNNLPTHKPIDAAISTWARRHGHKVAYSNPSIVDHTDGETLFQHPDGKPRLEPRRAWRTGTRDMWTRKAVTL